jgi:hypothetical protein
MERKIGTVVHGVPEKGWWLVRVGPPQSLEVYFLHRKFIRVGNIIEIGMAVEFEPAPPRNPGERPEAHDAKLLTPSEELARAVSV